MRRIFFTMLSMAVLIGGLTHSACAATLFGDLLRKNDIEIDISGSLDFYNQYIWRGMELDSDPVLQTSLTLSTFGFEGGIWSSFDVANSDGEGTNSDEVDGWIGYNFDLSKINEDLAFLGFGVGHTWYSFPGADGYTKELYVTLSADILLSPYFTWYYDYGDEDDGGADGSYYLLGIGHSLDVIEEYGVTLDLGYEVGFNHEFFIEGDGGYHLLTAGLGVALTENCTMTPTIAYSIPFGDLEDEDDGNYDDYFYAGVSMSFDL